MGGFGNVFTHFDDIHSEKQMNSNWEVFSFMR